jgi:hypothetical protein
MAVRKRTAVTEDPDKEMLISQALRHYVLEILYGINIMFKVRT